MIPTPSAPITEQLAPFPGHVLRDIARNPSTDPRWRKEAVRLMLERGDKEVNHPDLVLLVGEVQTDLEARSEVQAAVESAIEAPIDPVVPPPPAPVGPPSAGFTTKSMLQDEVIVDKQ